MRGHLPILDTLVDFKCWHIKDPPSWLPVHHTHKLKSNIFTTAVTVVQHDSLKTQYGLMNLSKWAPWPFGWVGGGCRKKGPSVFHAAELNGSHHYHKTHTDTHNPIWKHSPECWSQGSAHARPTEGSPCDQPGAFHHPPASSGLWCQTLCTFTQTWQ